MTPLVFAVMTASLIGSVHCAGMCGPFCAVAVGATQGGRGGVLPHVAYHGGRLVTYTLFGAAAGAIGSLVDMASTLAGLQPIALALAGGTMVLLGLAELAKAKNIRIPGFGITTPKALTTLLQQGQRFAATRNGVPRALTIGLLTTFLPCGWLYAFVVTAAGSGSPWSGAVVMAAFWVGTLPLLLSLGVGVRRLAGVFGSRLPLVTAGALVAVGLVTLSGRLSLSPDALAATATDGAATSGQSIPDARELPPCCRERESQK